MLERIKPGVIIIEGHVQGLSNSRALGEVGIPVIVIDKNNCLARFSKYCSKFFLCPDYIQPGFVDFLIKMATKHNLHGWLLLPSNDHAVISISKNRESLERFYKITTPSIDIIENIYDKPKLLAIAEKCNIPIPKTFYLQNSTSSVGELPFPVLTKGRNGLSFYKITGRKVFFSNSSEELKRNLENVEELLPICETFTQECIPVDGTNKTISFTAFCVNGEIKTHWTGIKVREHPNKFGTATFAESISINPCYNHSVELLKFLNYTGVCEIEYILDPRDQKYKLIEINARTWLWVKLAKACGINYAVILHNYFSCDIENFPERNIGIYKWTNLATDIPYSLLAIIKNQISIKEYFRSFRGKIILAIFSWKDILPALVFPFIMYLQKKKDIKNKMT